MSIRSYIPVNAHVPHDTASSRGKLVGNHNCSEILLFSASPDCVFPPQVHELNYPVQWIRFTQYPRRGRRRVQAQ
jgi:hypothetical protein